MPLITLQDVIDAVIIIQADIESINNTLVIVGERLDALEETVLGTSESLSDTREFCRAAMNYIKGEISIIGSRVNKVSEQTKDAFEDLSVYGHLIDYEG